jgi:hypothetical protein
MRNSRPHLSGHVVTPRLARFGCSTPFALSPLLDAPSSPPRSLSYLPRPAARSLSPWATELSSRCRCRSHCYALSPPQPSASSSSPAHATPNAPLPWSMRSPERPAAGDATGWSVDVRGWATLSHHGRSHEPHQLRLVALHPALAAGQCHRRAGAASTAAAEPPCSRGQPASDHLEPR